MKLIKTDGEKLRETREWIEYREYLKKEDPNR